MSTATQAAAATRAADEGHFHPRRLTHANLFVSDYLRSLDFYTRVVGLNEVYRQPLVPAAFLSNGNTHHDIAVTDIRAAYAKGRGVGLFHVAFELETEVELVRDYERATRAGITFADTQDHDIAHAVYGRDPDGNLYELYADVVTDWRNRRKGVVTKAKPPWAPGVTEPSTERHYHAAPPIERVEKAVFHAVKTAHAAFVARDWRAMVEHYRTVVGLSPLHDGGDWMLLGGSLGEPSLALYKAEAHEATGLHHVGFRVTDEADLAASIARLGADGIALESEHDGPIRRSAFVRDPDGFLLQFYVDRRWSITDLAGMPRGTAIAVF